MNVTVANINKVAKKYAIKLVAGKGYYYWVGLNDKTTYRLDRLQSTSVYVYRANHLTWDMWMNELDDILKEAGLGKLNENSQPNTVLLAENDFLEAPYKMMFDASAAKAHPFLVYKGQLHVGDVKHMHLNLIVQKWNNENLDYSFDGRIWAGPKVISFWEWPKNLKSFLNKLVTVAAKQQKIKIDLKTWKIEVKDVDTKKLIYVPISDVLSKDTKVIKQGKSVMLKHLQSPMGKKKDPVPRGMGSKKRPTGYRKGETPAQTRARMSMSEANQTRDKIYRMTAESAYKSLLKTASKKSAWRGKGAFQTVPTKGGYPIFAIFMGEINKRFDDLLFLIHPADKKTSGVYNRNTYQGNDIIDLFIVPNAHLDALAAGKHHKSDVVSVAIKSNRTLIHHELQHYLSINKRRKLPDQPEYTPKFGTPDYFNDPEELNAYYQQGAANMEGWVDSALKGEHVEIVKTSIPKSLNAFIKRMFNPKSKYRIWNSAYLDNLTKENRRKFIKRVAPLYKKLSKKLYSVSETAKRDYKDEYKKFQSSTEKKKYRAQLNKYNRDKGTYGNGDSKDASHKGGKIAGMEDESTNRGRAEKSRLKGSKRK